MQTQPVPYEKIVFVCVHHREDGQGPCCEARGGAELHAALKEQVKALGLSAKIRVSRSGCLNRCAKGPNIMVFPDNVWCSHVAEADLEPLVTRLVESLRAEGQLPRNYGG